MNYLGHLVLSDDDHESIIGNLSGDFVKGRLGGAFTAGVRQGIVLHRRVDGYTDRHPICRNLRTLFSRRRRRYAGIILDLAFDHMLCRHWGQFCDTGLRPFIRRVYRILEQHSELLPPGLARVAPFMVRDDWLGQYQTLASTGLVLDRISRRLSRENELPGSIEEVATHYEAIESGFLELYPDVIAFARETAREIAASDG